MGTTTAGPLGLRERKKLHTRQELERVAFELFSAHGFERVTIDDIAAAAGVSKRTFYRYFDSKEDVILSDQPRQVAALQAALAARPPDEPLADALREAFLHLADEYGQGKEFLIDRAHLIMATPSLGARLVQHQLTWEQRLAEVIADRLGVSVVDDFRPKLVAAACLAAVRVTIERWIERGGEDNLEDLIAQALQAQPFG